MAVRTLGSASGTASPLNVAASGAASVGERVIVAVGKTAAGVTPTVTDARGNVYALDVDTALGHVWLFSAPVTTAIQAGDAITVTVAGATHLAAGVLVISDPAAAHLASGGNYSGETDTSDTTWFAQAGTERWTDVVVVAVDWGITTAARTNTPGADWTEAYDLQITTVRTFQVLYRAYAGHPSATPVATGTLAGSGSVSSWFATAGAYKTATSTQGAFELHGDVEGSPSFVQPARDFIGFGPGFNAAPERKAAGQLWPRGDAAL